MEVEANKESGGSVSMEVSEESSVSYFSGKVGDRRKGYFCVGDIVYCKKQACNDLDY